MALPLAGVLAGAAGKAAAGLGSLAQVTQSLIPSLQGLVAPFQQFVEALSPSTMQEFGRVMRDLNAAVGVAFLPIVELASELGRELGALILPITQELQPVFAQLAKLLYQTIVPGLEMWANVFRALIPLFQLFADLLAALAPVQQALVQIFSAAVRTIGEAFRGLFGGDGLKTALDVFAKAIQTVAKLMLYAAVGVARFIGATSFVDNLIKGLQGQGAEKKSAEGLAAAQNPAFKSFTDYGRSLAMASLTATAGSGAPVKKTDDWLSEAVGTLKQIQSGQVSVSDAIKKALQDLWSVMIWPAIAARLPKPNEAYNAARDRAEHEVRRAGREVALRARQALAWARGEELTETFGR